MEMANEPSQMVTDWDGYMAAHGEVCAIEGPWNGQVDWSGAEPGEDWFFVLGVGHCGSSVLCAILNLHPDIHAGNEDKTVLNLLGLVSTETIITPKVALLHWQSGSWSGRQMGFDCETRVITAPFMRELCEVWRKHYGEGKQFCGDKHQHYITWRHKLRLVFPGCKFIYCTRHPLDQLSGLINDDWSGNRLIPDDPKRAWGQVLGYMQISRELTPEPDILTVPYETLCTEEGVGRIVELCCNHIGADFGRYPTTELSRFAFVDSVKRWQRDPLIEKLLVAWTEQGLMTNTQREVLTLPAEIFAKAYTEVEW